MARSCFTAYSMPSRGKNFGHCRTKFTPSADIDLPAFPSPFPRFPIRAFHKSCAKVFFFFCSQDARQDVYFRRWRKNNNRLAVWIRQSKGLSWALLFQFPRFPASLRRFCSFYKTPGLSGFLSGSSKSGHWLRIRLSWRHNYMHVVPLESVWQQIRSGLHPRRE